MRHFKDIIEQPGKSVGKYLLLSLLLILFCLFWTWCAGEAFDWQYKMWEQRDRELMEKMEEAAIEAGEPWEAPWRDPWEDACMVSLEEEQP